MRTQTFYDWLKREVESSRMALVQLYESRDKILYAEAQSLRQRYMVLIGNYEESVLQKELEVSLLRKKVELIQIAINRRETVDMDEIDAKIEAERHREIERVESADLTLNEIPQLTEQEQRTLQRQYREITRNFHPELNPNITETQRELYEKAVEAYKRQNVEEMKLIYDSLFEPVDLSGIKFEIGKKEPIPSAEEQRGEYRAIAAELSTDYLLAKTLYDCFIPLEEDVVVLDALTGYENQRRELLDEIAEIRAGFPFNAVEIMDDPAKREEYLAELCMRERRSDQEKAELEKKITTMMEERPNA